MRFEAGFIGILFITQNYAKSAADSVELTNKLVEAQTDPFVQIIIQKGEKDPKYVEMIIENIGSGLAKDIKFEINPDFQTISGSLKNDYDLIKKGLHYLGVHQRIGFILTYLPENYEEKRNYEFSIKISYKNVIGKQFTHEYQIDLYQFHGLRYHQEYTIKGRIL